MGFELYSHFPRGGIDAGLESLQVVHKAKLPAGWQGSDADALAGAPEVEAHAAGKPALELGVIQSDVGLNARVPLQAQGVGDALAIATCAPVVLSRLLPIERPLHKYLTNQHMQDFHEQLWQKQDTKFMNSDG